MVISGVVKYEGIICLVGGRVHKTQVKISRLGAGKQTGTSQIQKKKSANHQPKSSVF